MGAPRSSGQGDRAGPEAPAVADDTRLVQGTREWFDMVGLLMTAAATKARLPADLTVSFVEIYADGATWPDGLVQGLRFEIAGGHPSFRAGARPGERADIHVAVSVRAARALNLLQLADPAFAQEHARALRTGEMKVDGDLSRLGDWLAGVHDPIVERTR